MHAPKVAAFAAALATIPLLSPQPAPSIATESAGTNLSDARSDFLNRLQALGRVNEETRVRLADGEGSSGGTTDSSGGSGDSGSGGCGSSCSTSAR